MDFWKNIRYSLWLIPAIIVLLAFVLALAAIEVDARIGADAFSRWPRIFGASAEGARGILQVVAGAMITVAAMTFSITVLVLSLGASQYTPRIIRTFMGNRPTQTVLGVFVGIFAYSLIVLRSIEGGNDAFRPSIAVTLAILLALVGVGFLVYFIHHIASSIQASAIVSSVADETIQAIEAIYPLQLDAHPESDGRCSNGAMRQYQWYPILSAQTGYVQTVDMDALAGFADKNHLIVRMEKPVGAFVVKGLAIAAITVPPHKRLVQKLNQAYTISHYRTLELDAGSGVRQLVDIALKAMSPAINDTTTAAMCIDYLSVIMIKLASRCIVHDQYVTKGILTVVTNGTGFDGFLREAFEQIREHAQENAAIYVRLLTALDTLRTATTSASRKALIDKQMLLVMSYARRRLQMPDQIERVEEVQLQAMKAWQT